MANPKKTERNKELIKLRKKGWTYRKIAHQFNLDVKTVYNVVKRDGLVVVDKLV
jgi:DNA-binding NarL/FixJ family response regulator